VSGGCGAVLRECIRLTDLEGEGDLVSGHLGRTVTPSILDNHGSCV